MRWSLFVSLLVTALLAISGPVYSDHYQQKLHNLKQKIDTVKNKIQSTRHEKSRFEQQLQQAESRISDIEGKLRSLEHQIQTQQQRLAKLREQQQNIQRKVNNEQKHLGQNLRQAYILSRQSNIKLLLNAENPDQISRLVKEYQYVAKAHNQQIAILKNHQQQLENTKRQIRTKVHHLKKLKRQKRQHKQQLAKQKQKRRLYVKKLKQKLNTKQKRLKKLEQDRARLNKLINKLPRPEKQRTFRQQKGKLKWPIKGKILHHFGTRMPYSHMKRRGVVIKTSMNQSVHAIAQGQVVFANWLSGYGLVLIIDHGKGFMSIYAHNNSLLKQEGDKVKSRETIATTGQSGGYDKPKLYFALRHKGQPLNPRRWLVNHR